jgi:hypothetical protein
MMTMTIAKATVTLLRMDRLLSEDSMMGRPSELPGLTCEELARGPGRQPLCGGAG